MSYLLDIVIPCYNEEENIEPLLQELGKYIPEDIEHRIIFVDDGSSDKTLEIIKLHRKDNSHIHYITFSKNYGHQQALRAGLVHSTSDVVISMDADLQHPPKLIPVLLDKWKEGNDIVQTLREEDTKLPFLKRFTSNFFYKLINIIGQIEIEPGSSDFRLITSNVADVVRSSHDHEIFFRGFFSTIGFQKAHIKFTPNERLHGVTKYSTRKMMRLAVNGILSSSTVPLRFSFIMGFICSIFAFIYATYVVMLYVFTDKPVQGWSSVMISVLLLGGVQLITLGIIGEYLAKVFIHVKDFPSYIIKSSSLKNEK